MTKEEFTEKLIGICEPLPGSLPYSFNYKLNIKKQDEGKTILDFYSQKFNRFPSAYWQEVISNKQLLVNNKPVSVHYLLKSGEVTSRLVHNITEPAVSTDIKLIYLDDDVLIVDKPSPLPTSTSGRFIKNTLLHLLELIFEDKKIYSVHRLDANTTGLVAFALNKSSAKNLTEQFQQKTVQKTYLALVEGDFKENTSVQKSISKHKTASGSRETIAGEDSTTHIKIVTKNTVNTLLEVEPETGRTNQIRLHLASIGYPIVGDIGYKDKSYFENNPMTYPEDQLFLHAWKLQFNHPKSKERVRFEALRPKKFN